MQFEILNAKGTLHINKNQGHIKQYVDKTSRQEQTIRTTDKTEYRRLEREREALYFASIVFTDNRL